MDMVSVAAVVVQAIAFVCEGRGLVQGPGTKECPLLAVDSWGGVSGFCCLQHSGACRRTLGAMPAVHELHSGVGLEASTRQDACVQ